MTANNPPVKTALGLSKLRFDHWHNAGYRPINYWFLFFSFLFTLAGDSFAIAEMPDFYDEPGYSDTRLIGEALLGDTVDPFSGQLIISHTDLFLPGNGGLDLEIIRSYSTHRARSPFGGISNVGHGWEIHMGRVHFNGPIDQGSCNAVNNTLYSDGNPVLELSDGTKKIFYRADGNYGSRSPDFVTKDFWIAKCNSLASGGGMVVTAPNGTVYEFLQRSRNTTAPQSYFVTRVSDPRGNSITIEYTDKYSLSTPVVIDKITTSDGRLVSFKYGQKSTPYLGYPLFPLLTEMNTYGSGSGGGSDKKRIFYDYTKTSPSINIPPFVFLTHVDYGEGSEWAFKYFPGAAQIWSSNSARKKAAQSSLLKEIKSPLGAVVSYDHDFISSGVLNGVNPAVVKRSINVSGTSLRVDRDGPVTNSQGTWTYGYDLGSGSQTFDETTINTPTKREVYRHYGTYAATKNRSGRSSDDLWQIGTLLEKKVYKKSSSTLLETEKYQWGPRVISSQQERRRTRQTLYADETATAILLEKTITRNGVTYRSNYSNHDTFNNPTSIVLTSNTSQKQYKTISYLNNTSHWLIGFPEKERTHGSSGSYDLPANNPNFGINSERVYFESGSYIGLLRKEIINDVVTEYTYTGDGDIRTTKDAAGHITQYFNYFRGIPRRELNAENEEVQRTVDKLGRVTSVTEDSITHSYTYDKIDRLSSIDPPRGNTVTIQWPKQSRRELSRGGFKETIYHNNQGYENQRHYTGEESITLNKRYDVIGRVIFESYPNSSAGKTYRYDALNRMISVEEPGGKKLTYQYQSNNKVMVTDGRNHSILYAYRSFGDPDQRELLSITEPAGTTTVIKRDIVGNIIELQQNGLTRLFNYNKKKFLSTETHPELGAIQYTHDPVGNVMTKTMNGTLQTTFDYDDINRLKRVDYPSGEIDTYDYDTRGNLTGLSKQTVANTITTVAWTYEYDLNKNLTSEKLSIDSDQYLVRYDYNNNDALQRITYPSDLSVDYAPDNYNRPTQVGGFASNISYHPNGATASITYANGVVSSTALGERQNLKDINFSGIGKLTYDYDSVNNVTQIINTVNASGSKELDYDSQNRLTTATGAWGNAIFDYNERNNIVGKTLGGVSTNYAYTDGTNRLNSFTVNGLSAPIAYDAYGNIITKGTQQFAYDHAGNMIEDIANHINFVFDSNHRRVARFKKNGNQNQLQNITVYSRSGLLMFESDLTTGTLSDYIYMGRSLLAKRSDTPTDSDGDGVPDTSDAFPNDPLETLDSDGDGLGNNADAFPNDPTETLDSDGDGVGNNADAFPNDSSETLDNDGDGIGNNTDAFPNDPAETSDSDGDGLGDNADAFPNNPAETQDSDGDGVGDNSDAFPNDATETQDSDGDGVGDNTDVFPNNAIESVDSDGDGIGNNTDAFPNDPNESTDSDGDGIGDNQELIIVVLISLFPLLLN